MGIQQLVTTGIKTKRISIGKIDGRHIAVGPSDAQGNCICCGKLVGTMAKNVELGIEEMLCHDNIDCHSVGYDQIKSIYRAGNA